MFDNRFHTFLQKVILSNSEFRGSPHTQCLFCLENAPKFRENPETCEIPNKHEDQYIHCNILMTVQQHSENHSRNGCRFNFPRPSSEKYFISKPQDDVDKD